MTIEWETGNWKYLPESLTLYNQEARYEVDLEDFTSSAEALDWILQIAGKQGGEWDLPGFVNAIEKAAHHHFGNSAQGVFCPDGISMVVDWRRKDYYRQAITREGKNKSG